MTSTSNNRPPTVSALTSSLALGFKFLAWINGLGVVAMLFFGLGVIEIDLAPQWLRLPLGAFLGGLVLSALGLLWTYPAQASLINQSITGRVRRSHWIPLSCTMIAYTLSLLAFVAGCWITLGVGHLAYLNAEQTLSMQDEYGEPLDQSAGEADVHTSTSNRAIRFVY